MPSISLTVTSALPDELLVFLISNTENLLSLRIKGDLVKIFILIQCTHECSSRRGQKKASGPQELECQAIVSLGMRNDLRSSEEQRML